MSERHSMVLWLQRPEMIDLVHGAIRITNLPDDCRVEAMYVAETSLRKERASFKAIGKEMPMPTASVDGGMITVGPATRSVGIYCPHCGPLDTYANLHKPGCAYTTASAGTSPDADTPQIVGGKGDSA